MIDTHAHLNFEDFDNDLDDVLERSFEKGLENIIIVGTNVLESEKAISQAQGDKRLFATVGIHPQEVKEIGDFSKIEKMADNEKVVAIGETGLDYYRLGKDDIDSQKESQRELFMKHINLAKEKDLPLIFHNRDSHEDFYQIIKDKNVRGVIHCYTGDEVFAKKMLELGFMISFTGIITFDRGADLKDVIKKIPLDKIMVETDAPFLAPVPYRGKRAEPWMVRETIRKIAEIKGISFEEVDIQTSSNAKHFFGI